MGLHKDSLAHGPLRVAVCLTLVFSFVARSQMSPLMSVYSFIYNLMCLLFLDYKTIDYIL